MRARIVMAVLVPLAAWTTFAISHTHAATWGNGPDARLAAAIALFCSVPVALLFAYRRNTTALIAWAALMGLTVSAFHVLATSESSTATFVLSWLMPGSLVLLVPLLAVDLLVAPRHDPKETP